MTKRQVPNPLKEIIPSDDPEDDVRNALMGPPIAEVVHPSLIDKKRNFKDAQKLMRKFFGMGIGKRAIVCIKHIDPEDKLNPFNWGIVTQVKTFEKWPIQICWGDGRQGWWDETDLQVIYPSCPDSQMKLWLISDRAQTPIM